MYLTLQWNPHERDIIEIIEINGHSRPFVRDFYPNEDYVHAYVDMVCIAVEEGIDYTLQSEIDL